MSVVATVELRNSAGDVIVVLTEDNTANGERLRVASTCTGDVAFVDAIMLDALTWIPPQTLGTSQSSTEGAAT